MAKVTVKRTAAKKGPPPSTTTTTTGTIDTTNKKKVRRQRRKEKWSTYIYKLSKVAASDRGMTSKSMAIMNSFVDDTFEKIMKEASLLVKKSDRETMTSRDIQTACRLLLSGELANHAVSEAASTLNKYMTK